MRNHFVLLAVIALAACTPLAVQQPSEMNDSTESVATPKERPASTILKSFADAWRGEEEFQLGRSVTLGIWVDEEVYTINLTDSGGSFSVGYPSQFDWGFETDLKTLQRIDSGSLNALTAMGQARATDSIPLDVRLPDDFSENENVRSYYIPLTLHFWNREWPEIIRFGDGLMRQVHGANTTVLIYDKGLRTAWYQLKPGMHINADPKDQVNDFETAIVVTKGVFSGKVGGEERVFREGETVIVPAGVTHEFYANQDEYGEFMVLMWGDAA